MQCKRTPPDITPPMAREIAEERRADFIDTQLALAVVQERIVRRGHV